VNRGGSDGVSGRNDHRHAAVGGQIVDVLLHLPGRGRPARHEAAGLITQELRRVAVEAGRIGGELALPNETQIGKVLADFSTWWDLIQANFPTYDAPLGEPLADYRTEPEKYADAARPPACYQPPLSEPVRLSSSAITCLWYTAACFMAFAAVLKLLSSMPTPAIPANNIWRLAARHRPGAHVGGRSWWSTARASVAIRFPSTSTSASFPAFVALRSLSMSWARVFSALAGAGS
jgi:hypothetical protein